MDIEKLILGFVENVSNTNFSIVINILQIVFIVFWLFVLGWVWVDAGERTTKAFSKFASVLLVGVLNIVGLLIYLIIRPKQTLQDLYWIDLERRYLKYETSELGDCPNCKRSLQPGFNICPRCGFSIKQKCATCDVWIDRSFKYCPFCAQPVRNMSTTMETSISPDTMQSEVLKAKNEAIQTVEEDKTKYVERGGMVRSVKKDFFSFTKSIGDALLTKRKKNEMKKIKEVAKKENNVKKTKAKNRKKR